MSKIPLAHVNIQLKDYTMLKPHICNKPVNALSHSIKMYPQRICYTVMSINYSGNETDRNSIQRRIDGVNTILLGTDRLLFFVKLLWNRIYVKKLHRRLLTLKLYFKLTTIIGIFFIQVIIFGYHSVYY